MAKTRRTPRPSRARESPPTESAISGIDIALIAQRLDEEVDDTIREAFQTALNIAADEIPKGGPLMSYVRTLRGPAIEAIKGFVDIDPADVVKVRKCQVLVGDYLRVMSYMVNLFMPFADTGADAGGQEDGDGVAIDDERGE